MLAEAEAQLRELRAAGPMGPDLPSANGRSRGDMGPDPPAPPRTPAVGFLGNQEEDPTILQGPILERRRPTCLHLT